MVQPRIRQAIEADIPRLLPLMHELAVFEKYDQAFAVTEEVLREPTLHHPGVPRLLESAVERVEDQA